MLKNKIYNYLGAASGKKILVVGDLMLDRYVSGRVNRISPEAPVPVLAVEDEWSLPGGAANVALNIQGLGVNTIVAGYVGDDSAGENLKYMLDDVGVDVSCIVTHPDACTIEKTRVLTDRQQIVRVDREQILDGEDECFNELSHKLSAVIDAVDAIIIEDYKKGAITNKLIRFIVEAASDRRIPVGLDPKSDEGLDFSGITIAKPNFKEACAALNVVEPVLEHVDDVKGLLEDIGDRLLAKWKTEYLLISLGAMGMCLCSKSGECMLIPTEAKKVFDVSGAGDTVIATFMSALIGGADYQDAARIANHAAGVVVGKLGTASCSLDELLKFGETL